mmetsp:Transcript_21985/g.65931  ORF Transcript_21985/g.65931 Transcript_21985/m.65931 type:complete len:279 (+) Transcript_21985:183-1019(+)|eukprot:CAMPEP_0119270634 /NCGR_PEP_ID=MMETSP1329-20130426/7554_1 /TAXON_ID=114041 /ORGANISM="Genus nov. species nov., Strain RCC1024" /LENGTH=278 /DNA_ID=CAMNT_0007270659 /DNA_START=179 /DNA_END=1015 /DNA_ORIENTATION=+
MSAPAARTAAQRVAAGAGALAAASVTVTESREGPGLAGSWLEVGLINSPAAIDEGLRELAPAVEADPDACRALQNETARRVLTVGADLARDQAVQESVARRYGLLLPGREAEAAEGEDATEDEGAAVVSEESEADELRAMVASLTAELEALRAERGGGDADGALAASLEVQREALSATVDLEDVASLASESDRDSVRQLFASLDEPTPTPPQLPDADKDQTLLEELLGAALAVAALVLLVAATKKLQPAMAKRAAMICAGALAGVLGKFSTGPRATPL